MIDEETKCNLCIMHRCAECKCVVIIKQFEKENEELKEEIKNLCEWETDIKDILNDYEDGKYDDNEHQFVVDAFMIMNGVLNDIRRN